MGERDNGGPAFPTKVNSAIDETGGMSLRDYFAAKALAVFLQNTQLHPWGVPEYAKRAYEIADAMLAERSR